MSIDPDEDVDDDEEDQNHGRGNGAGGVNIQQYFNEMADRGDENSADPFADKKRTQTIAERERGTYNERRQKLQLSPGVRYDPFAEGSQTPDLHSVRRTTAAVMRETQVLNDKKELEMKLREKAKAGELKVVHTEDSSAKKKRRWDMATPAGADAAASNGGSNGSAHHDAITPRHLPTSAKDMETPMNRIWDATPGQAESGATTPPDLSGNFSGMNTNYIHRHIKQHICVQLCIVFFQLN
jgi:hypothetical protein